MVLLLGGRSGGVAQELSLNPTQRQAPWTGKTPARYNKYWPACQSRAPSMDRSCIGEDLMRAVLTLALFFTGWLLLPPTVAAGEREEALAVIDKAIKTHGGEAALSRAQNVVRKGTGLIYDGTQKVPFNDLLMMSLPGKMRWALELDGRFPVVNVISEKQGWRQAGGAVAELGNDALREMRDELYVWYLTTLIPLKQDGVELAPLPEIKIDGKPAFGVRVSSKGHPTAALFFDKSSGQLVKLTRTARMGGLMVDKETLYTAYKDFDGVRLCTQYLESVNGRKNNELKSATYELRKLDDNLFTRP
jgi:hypothetical protein